MAQCINNINLFKTRFTVMSNGCWIWNGCKDKAGYGYSSYNWKTIKAHRLSYKFFKGEIGKGMNVCHSCDNPSCVNPDHLWLGTTKQNLKDRNLKNRHTHGASHAKAVFGEHHIIVIRNSTLGVSELARNYGVSIGAISGIKKGRTWKHIPGVATWA